MRGTGLREEGVEGAGALIVSPPVLRCESAASVPLFSADSAGSLSRLDVLAGQSPSFPFFAAFLSSFSRSFCSRSRAFASSFSAGFTPFALASFPFAFATGFGDSYSAAIAVTGDIRTGVPRGVPLAPDAS